MRKVWMAGSDYRGRIAALRLLAEKPQLRKDVEPIPPELQRATRPANRVSSRTA